MSRLSLRFCSEFKRPMFDIEELPKGTLDIKATFNMGKGICSIVGVFKLITLMISIAILVHAIYVSEFQSFYFAYLTAWGTLFSICYLTGSFLLTTFSAYSDESNKPISQLVKFTWVLNSLAAVTGCCITVLYWAVRPAGMALRVDDVTTHGGILFITMIQGLLVDSVPLRLKHILFTGTFAVLYLGWTVIQNMICNCSPFENDDDDALYESIKWKTNFTQTLVFCLIIVFTVLPFLTILLWALSLAGRRYLRDLEKSDEIAHHEEEFEDHTISNSNFEREVKKSDEIAHPEEFEYHASNSNSEREVKYGFDGEGA